MPSRGSIVAAAVLAGLALTSVPPALAQAQAQHGRTVRVSVLPPPRPASLPGAAAQPLQPPMALMRPARPIVTAAADPAEAIASATALTERQIVERANAYFNGINALTGDFVQIGGDGRRLSGQLYVQRPGRLRFEYRSPASLEVIADGSSVAVRDRKLATQDLYPISQTPLKFLLGDRVELGRDIRVTDVEKKGDEVRVSLEDRSTLGGTSKITLFFDPTVQTLHKWSIVDPQGFRTTVVLSNLDRTRRVDPNLFVINYERMLGGSSR